MAQARIAAALGQRERAVSLLRGRTPGIPMLAWFSLHDVDYAPLRGYGPFEELVRPNEHRPWRLLAWLQRDRM
jgi:hypothetical protein